MKKIMIVAALSSVIGLACQKSNLSTTASSAATAETVNVNLAAGETYQYVVYASGSEVAIMNDAQNASQSKVSIVPGVDSSITYIYTPATGFNGTDVVTLQVTPSHTSTCQHHEHHADSCGGHHPKHHGKGPPKGGNYSTQQSSAGRHITLNFVVNAAQN